MTATSGQLAALNGLLARESAARADTGDARDKSEIVDDILFEAGTHDLRSVNERIERMIYARHCRSGEPVQAAT